MQSIQSKNAKTRINKGVVGSVARVQIPLSLLETRINKGFLRIGLNTVFKKVFKLFIFTNTVERESLNGVRFSNCTNFISNISRTLYDRVLFLCQNLGIRRWTLCSVIPYWKKFLQTKKFKEYHSITNQQ